MQKLSIFQKNIEDINTRIFGRGFYYFWEYDYPRAMKENHHRGNSRPKDLIVSSMFDPFYDTDILLCFKRCTSHDLIRDYYIPDSWDKQPLEIIDKQIIDDKTSNNKLVKSYTAILHIGSGYENGKFHTIAAQGFYYKLLR